jgi:hypothetical protein
MILLVQSGFAGCIAFSVSVALTGGLEGAIHVWRLTSWGLRIRALATTDGRFGRQRRAMQGPDHTELITGRVRRSAVVSVVLLIALLAAACGSSSSANPGPVQPPDIQLQGCTYVLNSTIPPGEPMGVQPHYAAFSADSSAVTALTHIQEHGGRAMIGGVDVPPGTTLYAGPDTSQVVGNVPATYAILAAEPVVWVDKSGDTWIAFFLSCGGENLYWTSLKAMEAASPLEGPGIAKQLAEAKASHALPNISIKDKRFQWDDRKIPYYIARGEQFGPIA